MQGLNEKQKRFCEEYIIDSNGTRAYRAVYKSCKSDEAAAACASKLLRNTKVKLYLKELNKEIHSKNTADAKEVMEYLTSVMRGKSEAETIVVEGKGNGYSKAAKIKKHPDEKEKLKAAELLGKRFGLFKEKIETSGDIPIIISGGDKLE